MTFSRLLATLIFCAFAGASLAAEFDPAAATAAYLAGVSAEAEANSNAYVDTGHLILLLEVAVEVAVGLFLLQLGLSRRWRELAERVLKSRFLQAFIYVPIYMIVTTILTFPLSWYRGFHVEHKFGLATQNFLQWFGEFLLSSVIALLGFSIFMAFFYAALRWSPRRWWLWGSALTMLFALIILVVSPLYFQPLFNDYRSMDAGPLRERILSIARANGMHAEDIKQVDESRQNNRVSANVSGIFGATRIALNDNLLKRASPDGVEAVMAHEIGHYVLNHQWKLLAFFALIVLFTLAVVSGVSAALLRRFGQRWGVRGIDDYAGLPLLNMIVAVMFFLMTPMLYRIVYLQEAEADIFAINATDNPDAWAEVALMTSDYRKLHPPAWEEQWLNHHPSPYARIHMAMIWKAENLPAPAEEQPVDPGASADIPPD